MKIKGYIRRVPSSIEKNYYIFGNSDDLNSLTRFLKRVNRRTNLCIILLAIEGMAIGYQVYKKKNE